MATGKSCDQLTLQEQLEETQRERMQLLDINGKLLEENKQLAEAVRAAEEARMEEFAARTVLQDKLCRLKAMMWDMEHPEYQ